MSDHPRAGRITSLPLHTFLMALLVPLNLAASNLALIEVGDVWRPWALLSASAAALVLGLCAFLTTASAAVVATAALAGLLIPAGGWAAIAAHGAAVAGLALFLRRYPAGGRWTGVLNTAVLAMLTVPIATIAQAGWQPSGRSIPSGGGPLDDTDITASGPLPSIVHVVLDGYGGMSALRSVMGFDNSAFVSDLGRLGFAVAPDARVPYNQTLLAMAAVFQTDYLAPDEHPLNLGSPARVRRALGGIVTDGPLHSQLRRLGYELRFTNTGWGFFKYPSDASVSSPPLIPNPLELHMLERHPLQRLLARYAELTGTANFVSSRQRQLTSHALAAEDYQRAGHPFFLYQHIIAPHPPFNVMPDGSPTTKWQEAFGGTADGDHATLGRADLMRTYREGYLAKLMFVNREILRQASAMIRDIPAPKVIFLHGDHGSGSGLFHDDPHQTCMNERMTTLLAVYSDDPEIRDAYEQFVGGQPNLVNLYRPLLDAKFGTSLGLAPSRSHFARWTSPHAPEPIPEEAIVAACNGL